MESDVPKLSIGALLRDAGAAALVAALLAFPLLGFRLVDSARGLTLDTRLLWVVYAAAAVFAGRIVFFTRPPLACRAPCFRRQAGQTRCAG